MSRTEFCDGDSYPIGLWEGARDRTFAGKRGQEFLKRLEAALVAWPSKKLVEDDIVRTVLDDDDEESVVGACALGVLAVSTGKDPAYLRYKEGIYETCEVGQDLGSTWTMAWTIAAFNDDIPGTDEHRYETVLKWVRACIENKGFVSTYPYTYPEAHERMLRYSEELVYSCSYSSS